MIRFAVLDKEEKSLWLPRLFDLCYENMIEIAPGELSYELEKQQWMGQVSPALEKEPRQIILCFADDVLAGYVQYYTNKKLLMIEEVQMTKECQQTTLFYSICKHLSKALPEGLEIIEAFAEKQNLRSQKLMQRLGMAQIEEDERFIHLRGSLQNIKEFLK